MSALLIPGTSTVLAAKIHPVVIYSICDSYIRRNADQDRVIGTLLGSVGSDGVVDVRSCFTVIHSEQDGEVAVDVLHQRTLLSLHQKVSPKDQVVGWFSTGSSVRAIDVILQNFYREECTNPIHLTLDTDLSEADASIVRTYVSRGVGLEDRSLATEFMEIPNEATMAEVRTIGFDTVAAQRQERIPTDVEALQRSLTRLRGLLDMVFKYVDDVCSGKRRGDPQVGRVLSEVVSLAASALSKEEVERALNDAQQDSMLVLYLSTLVRTQLALADKLQTATLPIFMSS